MIDLILLASATLELLKATIILNSKQEGVTSLGKSIWPAIVSPRNVGVPTEDPSDGTEVWLYDSQGWVQSFGLL